ncbi:uncharacterized protein F4822DRAFT_19008 [Hypoxylon trugodes]|uniref:uncharacterized protein n=1 Tax=Hypoxylon trugodes TaxID=326681 RepID=UPI00219BB680|nr:uncharacterized protein F4822DRAFT_19008 [Hypoxylon trugodes]KAI1393628.1 hypothetical protein F4822DRAFT_19008 [Hypoxylon trugodes]
MDYQDPIVEPSGQYFDSTEFIGDANFGDVNLDADFFTVPDPPSRPVQPVQPAPPDDVAHQYNIQGQATEPMQAAPQQFINPQFLDKNYDPNMVQAVPQRNDGANTPVHSQAYNPNYNGMPYPNQYPPNPPYVPYPPPPTPVQHVPAGYQQGYAQQQQMQPMVVAPQVLHHQHVPYSMAQPMPPQPRVVEEPEIPENNLATSTPVHYRSRWPSPKIVPGTERLKRPTKGPNGENLRNDKIPRVTRKNQAKPDVTQWYGPPQPPPKSWGPLDESGRHMFNYTEYGELERARTYSQQEMRWYVYGPKIHEEFELPERLPGVPKVEDKVRQGLTLWIGWVAPQANSRYPLGTQSQRCRFASCVDPHNTIRTGFPRIIFDERMNEDAEAVDPYHNAGYVHLFCFEQHFDIYSAMLHLDIRLDDRRFKREPNLFNFSRQFPQLTLEWERWWQAESQRWHEYIDDPRRSRRRDRPYETSLGYKMVKHTVDYGTDVRAKMREDRAGADVSKHMGNLIVQKFLKDCKMWDLLDEHGDPVPNAEEELKGCRGGYGAKKGPTGKTGMKRRNKPSPISTRGHAELHHNEDTSPGLSTQWTPTPTSENQRTPQILTYPETNMQMHPSQAQQYGIDYQNQGMQVYNYPINQPVNPHMSPQMNQQVTYYASPQVTHHTAPPMNYQVHPSMQQPMQQQMLPPMQSSMHPSMYQQPPQPRYQPVNQSMSPPVNRPVVPVRNPSYQQPQMAIQYQPIQPRKRGRDEVIAEEQNNAAYNHYQAPNQGNSRKRQRQEPEIPIDPMLVIEETLVVETTEEQYPAAGDQADAMPEVSEPLEDGFLQDSHMSFTELLGDIGEFGADGPGLFDDPLLYVNAESTDPELETLLEPEPELKPEPEPELEPQPQPGPEPEPKQEPEITSQEPKPQTETVGDVEVSDCEDLFGSASDNDKSDNSSENRSRLRSGREWSRSPR